MPGNPCLHVHLGNDRDGDGWVDNAVCDRCPNNSKKQEPGICDCPTLDTPENIADNDGDGVPNCLDKCPNDPKKQEPGVCGCGVPDIDSDGDGTMDCNDICPKDPNKQDRAGWCGCGEDESIDTDRDGYPDCLQVPRLTDVRTMSPVAIEIDVNVELDKETAEDPENYVVTGLPQIPIQRVRLVSSAMIEVVLGEAMVPRQRYTITFSGVLTAEGEAFEATRSFFGHVPARVPDVPTMIARDEDEEITPQQSEMTDEAEEERTPMPSRDSAVPFIQQEQTASESFLQRVMRVLRSAVSGILFQ